MKPNERHCTLCEAEGREQIGGVYIVACKQKDCGNFIVSATETDAYVAQLEATIERLQRLIVYAGGILAHGTPGSAWMDWKMRVQGVLGMKFRKSCFAEDGNAIPFSELADMVKDMPRVPTRKLKALGGKPEKCYTLKEIKDMFFPNRDLDSLRSELGVSPDQCPAPVNHRQ